MARECSLSKVRNGLRGLRVIVPGFSIGGEDSMTQERTKLASALFTYFEIVELSGQNSLDVSWLACDNVFSCK